jgi:uncharacterized protein (DUF433 family)
MALPPTTDPTPLSTDCHGVVRVGGTRVTLDSVVGAFLQGATAEEIALRYDVLSLSDVYATIAHYLRHRNEIDAYLAGERSAADETREKHARTLDVDDLRARLLARQSG